jgi:hypothetical protein
MQNERDSQPPVSQTYEIRFRGQLDERRARWFEDMQMQPMPDGVTALTGQVLDQSALYGILSRIRDLGLELISVRRI